jgi:hypothetical protein
MTTELAKNASATGALVAVDQKYGDDAFGEVSASGKWLPRVQLFGGTSTEVKRGKIPMAHYGMIYSKENIADLDNTFDFLPILWRPKAMELGEEILSVFDPSTAEFKRICAKSEEKDSGCMFGPEFLIWVPTQSKFASLYLASKTSRKAAPAVRDRLGKPCTGKVEFIETKKYSWHGPVFVPCSTPFALPTDEAVAAETEKFNNPAASEVEKADEPTTTRKR